MWLLKNGPALAAGAVLGLGVGWGVGNLQGRQAERLRAAKDAAAAFQQTIEAIDNAGIDINDSDAVNGRLCELAGLEPGCVLGNQGRQDSPR